jgi:hypothetical protein
MLPRAGRRWPVFVIVFGLGLLSGRVLSGAPGLVLWIAAAFVAVVSGFSGLWSG